MPTCQGQHPDGSPCRNPAAGHTRCYIHRRPVPAAALTREDVLAAIKEHVSIGLDISHENLSGVDLSRDAISSNAPWCSPNTGGVKLGCADLRGAQLYGANLQGADLVWAKLQGANVGRTNLKQADLGASSLERVDFSEVQNLTGVMWYGAVLEKTRMRRDQLGEKIGDELAAERGEKGASYDQAREAYLALKTNFNELGRYDDASWAYRKERRMERAMSSRWGWKWWWDGVAEWLTDYGENPWLAIRAVLIIWFIFGLLYSSVGSIGPPNLLKAEPVKVFDPGAIFGGFTYSLAALGTVGLESLRPLDRLTEVLTALEGIVGISLLALLMFTLGNRISRS